MTLKGSAADRSASGAGSFWRAFSDGWAAGAPWGALCDQLERYWRALPPSSAGAEPAADRWLCHRVHARGACRAESSTGWALALRSGIWSPEDVLAAAAHLAPNERDAALKDCALFLPQGSLNLLFAALEAAGSSCDRAWRALGGRLIEADEAPLAREALRRIVWPTLRVDLLKDLAAKLDVGAFADEVDAAWRLICASTNPSRYSLIEPLTELIPLASARSERAAFVERWVLSLPEREWEISQDSADLRVLLARAWAAAGDTDRALGWVRRIPDAELFARVSVLRSLPEPDRTPFAEHALASWEPNQSSGLLAEIAAACPALSDRCFEAASTCGVDPVERTTALRGLAPHLPGWRVLPIVDEIWAAAEALAPDDDGAREDLLVEALTVVAGREEPELRAVRERLFTSFVAAPTAWAAPRFALHLQGAHRDGLWRWIVDRSGATDDAGDIEHLATAARELFEGADDAFRERVHEDAGMLARAFVERLARAPTVAATLLAWVPAGEQREMALRVVRAERGPLGIARSLLDELLTVQWQENESAEIRDTVRALLVGCGKASLLPLADATTWGRAALVATTSASTESYLWHRKLFAGSLDESERTLLAELTDVESFVRWLDGEGRAFAVSALSALSAGDEAAARAKRPHLFELDENERLDEPPPIDRAAAMDHLRRLIANRSGVAGLVGSLTEAATPTELEEMVSILAQVTWFSMSDSSAVWSAVAWRWQALGDFARAQEVAGRSEFDQFRAELRFQLALASSQDGHLLAALGEVARLPYDPATSLFKDVEHCVRERRVGPVHQLVPCLERSTRVVVRSLLLASEAALQAPPGLPRARLEAELRAELAPLLTRAEVPRHACLSYAALALPSEVPALWDLAWSADARYEDNGIGFPASAARLAWRWRGAEGLDALVTIALSVA